jgi:hypothetical protein
MGTCPSLAGPQALCPLLALIEQQENFPITFFKKLILMLKIKFKKVLIQFLSKNYF